jgi:hypothetical protein
VSARVGVDAAVEAAARAIARDRFGYDDEHVDHMLAEYGWDAWHPDIPKDAATAITTALPSLRESWEAPIRPIVERSTLYEDAQRVHDFTHPTELAHRVAALALSMLEDLRALLTSEATS